MRAKQSRGFILVASVRYVYYQSAILCAESLRDHYPNANITLFTHSEWVDEEECSVFDNVITNIPVHKRAKLWALARSPYDITMYLDSDMQINDKEISRCFDLLPDDTDILMTKIRPYSAVVTKFPAGELTWHCGLLLYRKSKKTQEFFQSWYDEYVRQQKEWTLDEKLYPRYLREWDTWTFWKILHLNRYDEIIKISEFPEDARWNFHNLRYEELNDKSIIIYHNTIRNGQDHEKNITRQS